MTKVLSFGGTEKSQFRKLIVIQNTTQMKIETKISIAVNLQSHSCHTNYSDQEHSLNEQNFLLQTL